MIKTHRSVDLHRADGKSVPLCPGATVKFNDREHKGDSFGTIIAMDGDQIKVLWSIVPR